MQVLRYVKLSYLLQLGVGFFQLSFDKYFMIAKVYNKPSPIATRQNRITPTYTELDSSIRTIPKI